METALLGIFDDILETVASENLALLALLDLSAVFDTVNHHILIRRLKLSYGIRGQATAWLQDYLRDRTQIVS